MFFETMNLEANIKPTVLSAFAENHGLEPMDECDRRILRSS